MPSFARWSRKECSTLFNNGRGTHRIEGIGDKMVTLIHNVLTTDYVTLIHDDDCVVGLELLECRQSLLERTLGMAEGSLRRLRGLFGISGICNILGAIRMARYLDLGPDDNVVTIATDGFDRYPSVLANLEDRMGPVPDRQAAAWFEKIFRGGDSRDILDVRPREAERTPVRVQRSRVGILQLLASVSRQHEVAVVLGRRVRQNSRHRFGAARRAGRLISDYRSARGAVLNIAIASISTNSSGRQRIA